MDPEIEKKLIAFFRNFQKVSYKSNETVIESGKAHSFTYLLTEGSVRIVALTEDGIDLTLNTFKPYSFFPISPLINATEVEYPYEALTDSILYKAPNNEVLAFLKQNSDIQFDLLKRVFRGLDGYFQRMESVLNGSAQKRVVTELVIYALRFGKQEDDSDTYIFELTQNKLASMSGLSRETVTRQFTKLKNLKLISDKHSLIKIPNLSLLQNLLK